MKVLTYDMLARNFPKAWATIETKGEEVVVTRHRRRVACIVPEPPPSTALDVFGDLHGVLGERTGAVLAGALAAIRNGGRRRQTLQELRNPWAS
jgi:antitoxin (DNA-binding transcriptional repressor) of toxin-antitoxin stability system